MTSDGKNDNEIKKVDENQPVVWTPEDASRFLTSAIHEAQRPLADALKQRPITTKALVLLVGIIVLAGAVIAMILSGQLEKAETRAETAQGKHDQMLAEKHELQSMHNTLQDRFSIVNDQHQELKGHVDNLRQNEEVHKRTKTDLSKFRRHNDALRSQISGLEMEKAALARQLEAIKAMMSDEHEEEDADNPFEWGNATDDIASPEMAAPAETSPDTTARKAETTAESEEAAPESSVEQTMEATAPKQEKNAEDDTPEPAKPESADKSASENSDKSASENADKAEPDSADASVSESSSIDVGNTQVQRISLRPQEQPSTPAEEPAETTPEPEQPLAAPEQEPEAPKPEEAAVEEAAPDAKVEDEVATESVEDLFKAPDKYQGITTESTEAAKAAEEADAAEEATAVQLTTPEPAAEETAEPAAEPAITEPAATIHLTEPSEAEPTEEAVATPEPAATPELSEPAEEAAPHPYAVDQEAAARDAVEHVEAETESAADSLRERAESALKKAEEVANKIREEVLTHE